MLTRKNSAGGAPTAADDRRLRLVSDIHASISALLEALQHQEADEIEQQVHALESQCAAISALRHHQRAQRAQPATSADTSDTLLNAVSQVRGALQVARLFLAKLRRANAVMLQVHAVTEGSYSIHESGVSLRQ